MVPVLLPSLEPWAWSVQVCPAWWESCWSWPSLPTCRTWPLSALTTATTWRLTPPLVLFHFDSLFCRLHLKFNFTVINILCVLQRLLVPLSILTHCQCCYLKTCLLAGSHMFVLPWWHSKAWWTSCGGCAGAGRTGGRCRTGGSAAWWWCCFMAWPCWNSWISLQCSGSWMLTLSGTSAPFRSISSSTG